MPPPRLRLRVAFAAVATLLLATWLLVSCTGEPDDLERPAPAPTSLEPYAFTTAPPRAPTEVDGTYLRTIEGLDAVPCRRCAPYRLDGGSSTLQLEEGRFRILHEPPNASSSGFRSVGHYEVVGRAITFFNDPNCTRERGVYRWRTHDDRLVLETVRDGCFLGLRSEYLADEPWSGTG